MAGVSDPYALLGVPRGATLRQIKAAHRALAKRYHPDAPTADAQRFLRVQEAYQLLADPLRRREWDARHSPAPMRADQPASAAGRPSRARARPRRAPTEPPPEAASRSYTWSASEVPWWEEGSEGRRQARRARQQTAAQPNRPAEAGPGAADGTPHGEDPSAAPAEAPAEAADGRARPDFDVYSRSSGAAWSSAARAYFRRADQDLPRRGSFHHQGAMPLTAARARVAAEEEARRRPRAAAAAQPRRQGPASTATTPAAAAAGHPAHAEAARPRATGVVRDADQITFVRAAARERALAARWPSLGERLRVAALAWLPIALLIVAGGPVAAGCGDGAAACPSVLPIASSALAVGALAALVALPRLAYLGSVAAAGLVVSAGGALLGAWLLGVRPPQAAGLPGWAILGGALLLLAAWLVAGTWLLADRQRLPWVGPSMGARRR